VTTLTGVTANESSKKSTLSQVGPYLDLSLDSVEVGAWQNVSFMSGRQYDVVVADYLLGAVDYFAPHFQVALVRRLRHLVKPGGYLLTVGKEPNALKANSSTQLLLEEIDALRDSATILTRNMPYRELPRWWVKDELENAGFSLQNKYLEQTVVSVRDATDTWEWAGDMIKKIPDERLRAAYLVRHKELKQQIEQNEELQHGYHFGSDYAILARRL